ncbi:C4-dicarboxylate ABC transporter permease [Oligella sp. HMSC05A10]|uniref:TRAP transporter large permease n=1 Tax=Oligella sp. HMSC05A10 TaxID=1581112 RepID=UPI0008A4634E|nr:TRAP transporter large permease [Oligella sp. HMSC05A10]OFS84681.1 C4-dicarboxylate ABC transporter permease [Oligella sp. HMSC05A10]
MITLIVFLIILLSGIPIFSALLFASFAFIYEFDLTFLYENTLADQLYGALNKNGLLAIPLFMLVGELMNRGGLTEKLILAAEVLVGRIKGGLAYVNLLTNAMASSILGSATAQISIMSSTMIPEMVQRGYKKDFSAAVTMAGGLLGPLFPPSMIMIIYGVIAYQPISSLFLAGILPGIFIVFLFALMIFIIGCFVELPRGDKISFKEAIVRLGGAIIPGLIPISVVLLILLGVTTPTEAGAIASCTAFVIGFFVYKNIKIKEIGSILLNVATSTATITILIATATLLGWALGFEGIPDMIVEALVGLTDSSFWFLMLAYLVVMLLGMFLESISVMIVLLPILIPAIESYGIDPIHFGVMVTVATVVGVVTPPVGAGLFITMQNTHLRMGQVFYAFIPFLMILFVGMVIIALWPELSLWIPEMTQAWSK